MPDIGQLSFRAVAAVASGPRQRLSILIYHRVLPERDWMRPALPTVAEFDWQMRLMKRHFNVLSLAEALCLLGEDRLPPRAACVTFDDGYADNATVALPVMQKYGIPVTIFIASGYIDGGRMWNDTIVEALRAHPAEAIDLTPLALPVYRLSNEAARRGSAYKIIGRAKYLEPAQRQEIVMAVAAGAGRLPDNMMLDSSQIRTLHGAGVEIGGHTVSHPILSRLAPEQAREEIKYGKVQLEELIGSPLRLFAYPNGQHGIDYRDEHATMVREAGYEAAVSTNWGVSDRNTDRYHLPRFTPWDQTPGRFLLRIAWNLRRTGEAVT